MEREKRMRNYTTFNTHYCTSGLHPSFSSNTESVQHHGKFFSASRKMRQPGGGFLGCPSITEKVQQHGKFSVMLDFFQATSQVALFSVKLKKNFL